MSDTHRITRDGVEVWAETGLTVKGVPWAKPRQQTQELWEGMNQAVVDAAGELVAYDELDVYVERGNYQQDARQRQEFGDDPVDAAILDEADDPKMRKLRVENDNDTFYVERMGLPEEDYSDTTLGAVRETVLPRFKAAVYAYTEDLIDRNSSEAEYRAEREHVEEFVDTYLADL